MKPGAWLVEDMVLTPDSFTFSGPLHFITYVSAHISKEEFGLQVHSEASRLCLLQLCCFHLYHMNIISCLCLDSCGQTESSFPCWGNII